MRPTKRTRAGIPDPLAPFAGSEAHKFDIATAKRVTGVRGRSWSRHAAEPLVQAGAHEDDAVAVVHWFGLGALAGLVAHFKR